MAEPALHVDTLRALEQRLEHATRTAERLLGEAAAVQEEQDRAAPAGWRRRDDEDGDGDGSRERRSGGGWIDAEDAERLFAVLAGVRDRVPSELQQCVVAALRELLLAIRALVDWCLERAERRAAAPVEVQDIPIL